MRTLLVLGLTLLLFGCVQNPRVILPGTRYRIVALSGHALTLPPPVERMPVDKPLSLRFPIALGTSKQACSEANDLFRIGIDRKTRRLSLTMPSLDAWQAILPKWEQPDGREIEQKIDTMLHAPEALESRGCLSIGSAVQLRQVLRGAIPMRPGFDLYPAYGYRPGGLGLDLRPGVRLKVQRAHFEGPGRTIAELIGTSTVYYECRLDGRQRVAFAQPSVEYDSEKLKALNSRIALGAPPQPVYRLFLLTSFLKKGLRRSALVLGAPSMTRMQAMERQIASNPAIRCDELGAGEACVSFEGDVSVSAEVRVLINGKATYVDWSSSVRSVLRKLNAENATEIRLRRSFQGKLVPVETDPKAGGDALLSTALVAGEELSYRL